ncbi:MAG: hypothetical protein EBQ58_15205 [Betaproteobacteria bacterium]|nr:hypothetical protein [Betaproteobacteria bacterium]
MSGWKMDDNSFDITKAVALNGITSIGAGESVIFIESAAGAAVSSFKTFWGGLAGVQVGYYSGSGVSLSSAGDGVVIFDAAAAEVTRVSFPAATAGSTFYWGYNPITGVVDPSYNGNVSVVGTIGAQVTVTSSGDTGSLGTAIGTAAVPAPGAVALLGLAGLVAAVESNLTQLSRHTRDTICICVTAVPLKGGGYCFRNQHFVFMHSVQILNTNA